MRFSISKLPLAARSALDDNSDFINKIEANDLIMVWHLITLENESYC